MLRVSERGAAVQLHAMPTPKYDFAMPFWKTSMALITLGGFNSQYLAEVQKYSIEGNRWEVLPTLPEPMQGSAATIVGMGELYNFGGRAYSCSVFRLLLEHPFSKWERLNYPLPNFSRYCWNGAATLEGKVVLFGSHWKETVFVIEKARGVWKSGSTACELGDYVDSLKTYNGKLYAFSSDNKDMLYCFGLHTRMLIKIP